MPNALIVGANRGLGASLTRLYAAAKWNVLGTTRASDRPEGFPDHVIWIPSVDLMQPTVGQDLASYLKARVSQPLDLVVWPFCAAP